MLLKGAKWYEWQELYGGKLATSLSIAFAFVSTHNHFVLDRGGKVFNRTAPVIKLPDGASEDDHLALLGVLNSSTGNFWVRQIGFSKGGDHVGQSGARVIKHPWDDRLERDGTKLLSFPLPERYRDSVSYAQELDKLAVASLQLRPTMLAKGDLPDAQSWQDSKEAELQLFGKRVALQEELDWLCYGLYGLLEDVPLAHIGHLPQVYPGERAFELEMSSSVESDPSARVWFERHGIQPQSETPLHWPREYRALVERRRKIIRDNAEVRLIEAPAHKNRWQRESWSYESERALENWLLERLETSDYWSEAALSSCARIADRARRDPDFVQVARLYAGADVDISRLCAELAAGDAVPYLAAYRYTEPGLSKRADWESTWDLQRREDAGETVGSIPVPPKYAASDYADGSYWSLRGKLDVPKERFISYPNTEREADPSPVLGWAGWNHLQQAQALATCFLERKQQEGWTQEKLMPMLAGLVELLPWLKQWHNDVDPETGERLGDFYAAFVDSEARQMGVSLEQLRAWRPPAKAKGRQKKKGNS